MSVAAIAAVVGLVVVTLTGCTPPRDDWSDYVESTCRNGDRLYAVVGDEVEGLAVVDDDPACRGRR